MKKIEDQWKTKLALWKISEVDNILDKLTKEYKGEETNYQYQERKTLMLIPQALRGWSKNTANNSIPTHLTT